VIWDKTFVTDFADNLESAGRALLHEFRKPSGPTQRPAPRRASCLSDTTLFWAAEMDARLQPQLLIAEPTLGSQCDARLEPRRYAGSLSSRRPRADFSRVRRPSSAINLGFLQLR
jgi:hypothetical protein